MNDLERTYFDAAFASAYPEFVEAEREEKKPKPAAGPKGITPKEIVQVTGESLAGMAKGTASQTIGLGGDIREIVDLFAADIAKTILGERRLPTTEEMQKWLPQVPVPKEPMTLSGLIVPPSPDPRHKQAVESAEKVGEFLPVAPIAAIKSIVKGVGKILKYGADGKRVSTETAKAAEGTGRTIKYDARGKRLEAEAAK